MIIPFKLNGETVYADSQPGERLVSILRERFNMLQTKAGCLSGRCGSCTVLVNDMPMPSCIVPVFQIRNSSVVTLEGFKQSDYFFDIEEGFRIAGVTMCGFCDAGKILMTHAILRKNLRPSTEEIRKLLSGNLCRCTSIEDLTDGVKNAALIRRKRENVK